MGRIHVVSAIVVRDGRLLLTQRKRGAGFEYRWCTPGGKVDEGETPEQALAREMREEVGAEIVFGEFPVGYDVDLDPPFVGKPLRVVGYRVSLVEGGAEPTPLEGQGLGWFSAQELASLPLTPADAHAFPALLTFIQVGG